MVTVILLYRLVRYGLFHSCVSSPEDCLLSCCCAPCYAAYASHIANESAFMSLIQCLCYPWALCCLRPRTRGDFAIPVLTIEIRDQTLGVMKLLIPESILILVVPSFNLICHFMISGFKNRINRLTFLGSMDLYC